MKIFLPILLLFLYLPPTSAQKGIAGSYKLYTHGDSSEIMQGAILTINCNNTFSQKDSMSIGYGKWRLKNDNKLTVQFDSIVYSNKTLILKTKLHYLIKDGRIFRTSIPKKEHTIFTKEIKKYLRSFDNPFRNVSLESFSVYKAKMLRMYYQLSEADLCMQKRLKN